jgi:glycosyltransferase involved in cell wall biosynthesis
MDKHVKVLHVITRLVVGGAQENTLATVKLMSKQRYETLLVTGPSENEPEGSLEGEAEEARVPLIKIPELVRNPHPVKDAVALWKLFYLMKKTKFDIVHTHCSKAGILGRIAAKLAGVPIIVHTPHGHVFYGYFNASMSWLFIVVERFVGMFTDKIITLTDRGKEEHIYYRIAKPEKFTAIPSGIDLRILRTHPADGRKKREELGLRDEDFLIGTIARLAEIKGHKYLVAAIPEILREIPQAKLLLVGDGPLKNELVRMCYDLNIIDKVLFLGIRKDVPALISIMDLFVLPSLNEGMGKVFLQVQAMGKAVIAADVGGVSEIVKHGENGLLVPPKDVRAIAQACIELFKDPARSTDMGVRGRQQVDNRFSVETMVETIEHLYEELIAAKKGTDKTRSVR